MLGPGELVLLPVFTVRPWYSDAFSSVSAFSSKGSTSADQSWTVRASPLSNVLTLLLHSPLRHYNRVVDNLAQLTTGGIVAWSEGAIAVAIDNPMTVCCVY